MLVTVLQRMSKRLVMDGTPRTSSPRREMVEETMDLDVSHVMPDGDWSERGHLGEQAEEDMCLGAVGGADPEEMCLGAVGGVDPAWEISLLNNESLRQWICEEEEPDEEESMLLHQVQTLGVQALCERGDLQVVDEVVEVENQVPLSQRSEQEKTCGKGYRTCPICQNRVQMVNRHVRTHLPPYVSPKNYCWSCNSYLPQPGRRDSHKKAKGCEDDGTMTEEKSMLWMTMMMGMLLKLCSFLRVPGLAALFHLVQSDPDLRQGMEAPLTDEDRVMMDAFENWIRVPSGGILVHWRILLNLVKRITAQQREDLKTLIRPAQRNSLPVVEVRGNRTLFPMTVTDSHFHLDRLLSVCHLNSIQELFSSFPDILPNYVFGLMVTCYAYPERWPTYQDLDQLSAPAPAILRCAIGWHPTRCREAFSDRVSDFKELISHPLCVAVGEVGLDYHRTNSSAIRSQQRLLIQQIVPCVVESRKPIVIHCRESRTPNDQSATEHLIAILERRLPRNWPVYVHCFDGGLTAYVMWMEAFPNVMFGISPLALTSRCHPDLRKVIRMMSPQRILLETDAPYLSRESGDATPLPTLVLEVSKMVADVKDVPEHVLLKVTTENANMFFLPWSQGQ
jgi:TatD DNase family protein